MTLRLEIIPLEALSFDPRNPRSDAAEGLEELAASMQTGGVVQPPILIPIPSPPEGGTAGGAPRYRVLVGERRVRAAMAAGLESLPCLVREALDPLDAHRARVVENLHRRELNPIDHATALRVSWLAANADALGLREQAEEILSQERPLVELLPQLETLLDGHGFTPTAPAVTWGAVLDELGVEMSPARRKKLLRVLAIPQDVQKTLRETPVTEAAVRAIGTLDEDAQRQVAAAIQEDPALARKARRIARAVRDQDYSVDEALAEARGQYIPPMEATPYPDAHQAAFDNDQTITDAVLRVLEEANIFLDALDTLRKLAPTPLDIPAPWGTFYRNAMRNLLEEVKE